MITPSEEAFVHYVDCIDSLNRAWSILQALESSAQVPVVSAAAFRLALIEYSKPYTRAEGAHSRRYQLPAPNLAPDFVEIHNEMIHLRNKTLAHSDLTVKDAVLHIHTYGGKPYHLIASNRCDAFPDRKAVIELIEQTLDQMYPEAERRLEQLEAQRKTREG